MKREEKDRVVWMDLWYSVFSSRGAQFLSQRALFGIHGFFLK